MSLLRKLFVEGRSFDPNKKCSFCGKRLKKTGPFTLASVCHHCGRTQPWAEEKK